MEAHSSKEVLWFAAIVFELVWQQISIQRLCMQADDRSLKSEHEGKCPIAVALRMVMRLARETESR